MFRFRTDTAVDTSNTFNIIFAFYLCVFSYPVNPLPIEDVKPHFFSCCLVGKNVDLLSLVLFVSRSLFMTHRLSDSKVSN